MTLPPAHVNTKEQWLSRKATKYRPCTCRSWEAPRCHCKGCCSCHYEESIMGVPVRFDATCFGTTIYDSNAPALEYKGSWVEVLAERVYVKVFEKLPSDILLEGIVEYQRRFQVLPQEILVCAVPLEDLSGPQRSRRKWPKAMAFGLLLEAGYPVKEVAAANGNLVRT